MYKVKTFGIEVLPMHVHKELMNIDEQVNNFLAAQPNRELVSVGDVPVTDDKGETIGIIRCVGYRDG